MKISQIKEHLLKYNAARRVVQLLSFVLFSSIVLNVGVLPLLLPILWTWGLQQNTVGDAFTAIQINFYYIAFPWLAFASFLIVSVLIGKSMCGWICPFGFVQDLLSFIKRRKSDLSTRTHETMVYAKYVVLGLTLFISTTFSITKTMGVSAGYEGALGVFAKAPFTALSPAETLFGTLPNLIKGFRLAIVEKTIVEALVGIGSLPILFWVQFGLMIAVLAFAAYIQRGWCKYFCPHGAIMAFLSGFSFVGLRRDPVKCARSSCRQCAEACPMHVPILNLPWEKFSHPECIYCMKCADACKDKAIKLRFP